MVRELIEQRARRLNGIIFPAKADDGPALEYKSHFDEPDGN